MTKDVRLRVSSGPGNVVTSASETEELEEEDDEDEMERATKLSSEGSTRKAQMAAAWTDQSLEQGRLI